MAPKTNRKVMENKQKVDWKRVLIYIFFAYSISWLTGLVVYLRGGFANSRKLIPGSGLTEAFVLIATLYMFAPAISNALTRLITKEGWQDTWLKPNLKGNWPHWLVTWFGTAALIAVGGIIYFLLFPKFFDPTLSALADLLALQEQNTGQPNPFSPGMYLVIQVIFGILISPFANLILVFGEEFGWRAYLQPKLLPLGRRWAIVLTSLIWGLWHAPMIAMGYNYGLHYPGAPWTGILTKTIVIVTHGIFFGWACLQARSVWPAVIGHAVLNGTAASVIYFTKGATNPLLGPSVAGLVGTSGFTLSAILILLRPGKEPAEVDVTETT
jgi:membrane protease YdiL (CAAX protease family)